MATRKKRPKRKDKRTMGTCSVNVTSTTGGPVIIGGRTKDVIIYGECLNSIELEAFVLNSDCNNIDKEIKIQPPDIDLLFPDKFLIGVTASANVKVEVEGELRSVGIKKKDENLTGGACPANSATCYILADALEIKK